MQLKIQIKIYVTYDLAQFLSLDRWASVIPVLVAVDFYTHSSDKVHFLVHCTIYTTKSRTIVLIPEIVKKIIPERSSIFVTRIYSDFKEVDGDTSMNDTQEEQFVCLQI